MLLLLLLLLSSSLLLLLLLFDLAGTRRLSDRQLAVLATSAGVLLPLVALPSFHWLRHAPLLAL